jgi:hypothetical protein
VLFVDADCLIQPGAPPLDPLEEVETPILMALGRSGRLNSGVIFARCSDTSVAFFGEVMQSITQPIRAEDRAQLKYENGNIIHCARRLGGVGELDPKWNNTSDPELADYVRHFTGPMRPLHTPPPLASVVSSAIGRLAGRTRPGPQPESRPTDFRHQLDRLATAAVTRYRAFNPRPTTP